MAEGDIGEFLTGFDPRSAAGMGATYETWLRDALGGSPIAYGYGARQMPNQILQYLSSPLAAGSTGAQRYGAIEGEGGREAIANPFLNWLGGGPAARVDVGSPTPLGEQGWISRGRDIQAALAGQQVRPSGGLISEPLREQIYERFSPEMAGVEQAADYQRQLAFAPILAGTSGALQGEMGNVLNRMYRNWLVNQAGEQGDFLKYAQQVAPEGAATGRGLWQQFGVA